MQRPRNSSNSRNGGGDADSSRQSGDSSTPYQLNGNDMNRLTTGSSSGGGGGGSGLGVGGGRRGKRKQRQFIPEVKQAPQLFGLNFVSL